MEICQKKKNKKRNIPLITALYQNSDPHYAHNNRGLSVAICLGKLFTGRLHKGSDKYPESNNLLTQYCDPG